MEEFVIVKHRHRKRAKVPSLNPILTVYTGLPTDELCQKIKLAKCLIHTGTFYQQFLKLMDSICHDGQAPFSEVLCYGIGHIGMCQAALHQVALLTAMVEEWKPSHTWVFDPVLCTEEIGALEASGLEVLTKNEACRRTVAVKTLAYMPHCGKAMYNNLLWANWDKEKLQNLTIIGNTFSTYTTRLTSRQLEEEAWFISTIFPMQRLAQVPSHVWTHCSQPAVDPTDPEIVL